MRSRNQRGGIGVQPSTIPDFQVASYQLPPTRNAILSISIGRDKRGFLHHYQGVADFQTKKSIETLTSQECALHQRAKFQDISIS